MNKKELEILEMAFSAEIAAALGSSQIYTIQTKSKVAKRLEEEGFLKTISITLGGRIPVVVTGYALTELGHFAYCTSCSEEV